MQQNKTDKFKYTKTEDFCLSKDYKHLNARHKLEKTVYGITSKGFILKIHKEHLKFQLKYTTDLKWASEANHSKEKSRWSVTPEKMFDLNKQRYAC